MESLLLDKIDQPSDLKKLNAQQVEKLCAEIRHFMLENISKTGGHLASNLGTVELTVALHRVLETPKDKIVFDVGHQCYTHKLLTGRRKQFDHLRQLDGISGFPNPHESVHDAFIAGHGNTALSLAIGMAWAKKKQADEINELLKKRGEIDNIQFGGKISSELLLPKILQIVEEDPELYDEAASFLEVGDWLTQILTNGRKRSGNLAGYKAMWTPETGYPSKDFLLQLSPKLENLTEDKLGDDITLAGQPVGYLTEDWAKELGLCAGIPIATAVIDSHAGMPGSGVSKSDQMMMVLGTSSVMLALSENGYSKNGVVSGIKGAILPKKYALESGLAAVGDMLGWFVDNCVSWEYKQMADQQGMDLHSWLTRKAEKLSPGGHGLLALDWWNGNKTPYVDGRLSGVLVGCTLLTKPEEIYRALIESTAFGTKKIMQLFAESGVKIHTIIASGGIAEKNSLLMQIYADVLNCEIHISGTEQTAALGAAIYASVAAGKDLGGYETIQEAVANMSHLKDIVYKPNPPMVEKYVELYQMYCNLVEMFNPQKNTTMITLSQLH